MQSRLQLAVFVLLSLGIFAHSQNLVVSSGPAKGRSTSQGDTANQQSWSNVGDISDRDYQPGQTGQLKNTYAIVNNFGQSEISERIEAYQYKFDLSSFGSIAGIQVEYSRRSQNTVFDYSVELVLNGAPIPGTNRCNITDCSGTTWNAGPAWSSQIYGGPTDLWGTSGILKETVADPNFGVGIRCRASGSFFVGDRDPEVDYVNITIYGSPVTEGELGLTSSEGTASGSSVVVPAVVGSLVVLLVIGILIAIIVLVKRRPDLFQRLKNISDAREAKAEERRKKEASSAESGMYVASSSLKLQVIGEEPKSDSYTSKTSDYSAPPPKPVTYNAALHASTSTSPAPFIPGKSSTPTVANYSKVVKSDRPATFCFGVDLESVRKIGKIPVVVEECIALLESKGLTEEGLLRLAGSTSDVSRMKDAYNEGKSPDFARNNDINNVAGLLKLFFRELPQKPLLMTQGLKKMTSMTDHDQAVELMRSELQALPPTNFATLKRLFVFLQQLAMNSQINKMSPENLAIVFSPTLNLSMPLLTFMIACADKIF